MPKGNLLKQNFPKGVINVVNRQESSDNGIYSAINLVNTVAPASLPKVSSTEGMGCTSLKDALVQWFQVYTNSHLTQLLRHHYHTSELGSGCVHLGDHAHRLHSLVLCHKVVEAHFEECTMNMEQHP